MDVLNNTGGYKPTYGKEKYNKKICQTHHDYTSELFYFHDRDDPLSIF